MATTPAPVINLKRERPATEAPDMAHAYAYTALAIGAIWISVALAAVYAPDMVTGSQHEHLASGWGGWLWGAIATGLIAQAALEGIRARMSARTPWLFLGVSVAVIWAAVVLASVFTPLFVTGTDPTMIPFGAWLVPIGGLVATGFVCAFVKAAFSFRPATEETDEATKLRQLAALRDAGAIREADFEGKKNELLARM
ncbi:MAG TPA: SHOCT domain-containing protein [Chloroflexota bacterium]|nr:SHOCT domain-containing protein [Chloroflexota bacterium]